MNRIGFTDGSVIVTGPITRIETDDPELTVIHCTGGSLVAVRKDLLKYVLSDSETTQDC